MADLPDSQTAPVAREPFVAEVRLRNYKSIEKCAVGLSSLTLLVGRNGSGKSNFLDALRFVADALESSLDHAIKSRGGIDAVRRRSTGHPRNFTIALKVNLPTWHEAAYGFEVAARPKGGFAVKKEWLRVNQPGGGALASFDHREDQVESASHPTLPPAVADRLYLVTAAGMPEFRPVYDGLRAMGFYSLNPDAMKELQDPDAGQLLCRDGSNIASVLRRLNADRHELTERINRYLGTIVAGISGVDCVELGPKETIEFRQQVQGSPHPWRFYAKSMSDGTLRALGALVAVTQLADRRTAVTLVGIEEPEAALHPAAAGALLDALREAVPHTQVVVTSHSPDLLEHIEPDHERLLAVQSTEGKTGIGPVDPASLEAIHNHLYTPGELLRMDQLDIDRQDLDRQRQMFMFDEDGEVA